MNGQRRTLTTTQACYGPISVTLPRSSINGKLMVWFMAVKVVRAFLSSFPSLRLGTSIWQAFHASRPTYSTLLPLYSYNRSPIWRQGFFIRTWVLAQQACRHIHRREESTHRAHGSNVEEKTTGEMDEWRPVRGHVYFA